MSTNGFDPDQDRLSVGPDLGPNWLQRLSADDKARKDGKSFYFRFEDDKTIIVTCGPSEDINQPVQPSSLIRVSAGSMKVMWIF